MLMIMYMKINVIVDMALSDILLFIGEDDLVIEVDLIVKTFNKFVIPKLG